jgi:hypothetical protein
MDEIPRTLSSESYAPDAGKWIARVVIAVILAEGIWGLIVSVTNNLILPLLARTMGGDIQSPLYLGKGDFNVPALFTAVLELCFAGIVAVLSNSWLQRKSPVNRGRAIRVSPIPVQPAAPPPSPPMVVPVPASVSAPQPSNTPIPAAPAALSSSAALTAAPSASPSQFWSPAETSPQPKAAAPPPKPAAPAPPPKAKPVKPKPPKEIYYNIVGEPINPTEDD